MLFSNQPTIHNHILEMYASAWIGLIAPDNDGEQQTVFYNHILQGYIANIDPGLGLASSFGVKGVQHASRPSSSRLLLLLWADVDCPPDGLVHGDVLVEDVFYFAWALIAWVGLHINALERFLENWISECYISDAVVLGVWRHTSDGEPNAQPNRNIFHQHILSAVVFVSYVRGLGDNNIVVVLHRYIPNMVVYAWRIDAVGVERESWQHIAKCEPFGELELGSCIDFDVEVVDFKIGGICEPHMETGWILEHKIMNFELGWALD